ncbi:hypothetical protein [Kitasatospora sp. DSM 101779]|uniref:hypothetical protein n=1 Tax=Kitasatospora sp. DSM 101779 TaxID=2853165 RepID=UPI0021D8BEE9|nr:hypothetical protein [Kitasatospora sp. DSM 101779]MCU7826427.1 hypothetical protein [Kitasatospora sp. DSM 101779]
MANEVVQTAEPLVTACGRRIGVGRLVVDGLSDRISRVTLDVGPERDGTSRIWAGLTPAEARELARRLLDQADRAESAASSASERGAIEVAPSGSRGRAGTRVPDRRPIYPRG